MYYAKYSYQFKNEAKVVFSGVACFSELFRAMEYTNDNLHTLKVNLQMFTHKDTDHNLTFSKEEVDFVFEKLRHIINPPLVMQTDDGLSIDFEFTDCTRAHVKTLLSLARMFYESNPDSNSKRRQNKDIMKSTINFCKIHEDISLIEVLQFMHYNCYIHGGHSLVEGYSDEYTQKLVSEASFTKRMKDPAIDSINEGIFKGYKHEYMKTPYEITIESFNLIEKI